MQLLNPYLYTYHQNEIYFANESTTNALVVEREIFGLTLGVIVCSIATG